MRRQWLQLQRQQGETEVYVGTEKIGLMVIMDVMDSMDSMV